MKSFRAVKLAFPVSFVWIVLFLTLIPDLLNLAGINFGQLDWSWKAFIHRTLETGSFAIAFLIVFISFIDFKIKGDVSTPIVATTMFCSGILDLVHVLASEGLILQQGHLNFINIYTWVFSRTFNAFMLLSGAGLFFIQSDNLFKNVKKHNTKFLLYVVAIFSLITIAYIFLVADLNQATETRLSPFVFSRKLDFIPLILYLFSLTIIFPKFYTNHPSIFSQTVMLSLVPSISAQLHVIAGPAIPYDNLTMIASYEKLISYLIPFMGIAMNYLQTHYSEVVALGRYRAESNQKNQANALLEGVMDVSLNAILVFENVLDAIGKIRDFRCIKYNRTAPGFVDNKLEENTLFSEIFRNNEKLLDACMHIVPGDKEYNEETYNAVQNKWLRITVVKYRNGFVMTIIDISESRNSLDAILKREEMLLQAEEIGQLGSWEWDTINDRVTLSDNLFRLYGIDAGRKELTFEDLYSIVHSDDRQEVKSIIYSAMESGDQFDLEFRMIKPGGIIIHIAAKGRVKRNLSGKVEKVAGISMDITSKKIFSEKLRNNEILYRTFASNMPDTEVILFDTDFAVRLVEGNLDNPLLTNKQDLYENDVRKVLVDLNIKLDPSIILNNEGESKVVTTMEIDSRYFKVHLLRISGEEGHVLSGMILIQDITEIKKAELQLELKLADLDRSNKELENFAYVASHDLQEPLRKITAFGDRLKVKYSSQLPEDGVDYIRRMTEATNRMQRLITDLLAFSRITRITEPFQKIDLNKIITDIISDIEIKIASTGAEIKIETLENIEAIPSQMQQLFQNLLLNAIKFHKENEKPLILVSGELITTKAGPKRIKAYKIIVKDNGIGFEQEYAERIFTLFQRLHGRAEYEGTGIGLALCKKIAEHHGGTIVAFSNPGEGASFIITLPVTQLIKEQAKSEQFASTN